MKLSSDLVRLSNSDANQFHKFLQIFQQIINILEEFEDNYEKKLNFTKLVKIFNIPDIYTNELISLIIGSQEIFNNIFSNYYLKKRKESKILYLIIEKKVPNEIEFTTSQINHFNDIIYSFRYIKRGKGFDISNNGTEFLSHLKLLRSNHPYLFETKENGLIYPSRFGIKLGDLIISYNKGNKEIRKIVIDNCRIVVKTFE